MWYLWYSGWNFHHGWGMEDLLWVPGKGPKDLSSCPFLRWG